MSKSVLHNPSDLWKHTPTYTEALKPTKQQPEKIAAMDAILQNIIRGGEF